MRQRLTIVEAARLIFRAASLQSGHVRHVEKWLEQGELDGQCVDSKWYTSRDAIARFMARRAVDQLGEEDDGGDGHNAPGQRRLSRYSDDGALKIVYRQVLKDYFLAVLLRRRTRRIGRFWRRAVLAGQVALVASVAGVVLCVALLLMRPAPIEHRAIDQWLAQTYQDGFTLMHIGTPLDHGDTGDVFLVKYRYGSKHRGQIHTEQYFVVRDGKVIDVSSER